MAGTYYTQVLPIKYGDGDALIKHLREILQTEDFIIRGFLWDQWTVEVPRELTPSEIATLTSRMNNHY
ncbi:hypothetical protein F4780DRAFT_776752 [Xylariomycetidae sp. FL0641]|nr:hypothetical protein F4780DRAFT_776752 [Xylariomycetidae sp. FL0641]